MTRHAPTFQRADADRLALGCSCNTFAVSGDHADAGIAYGRHVLYHQASGAGQTDGVPAAPSDSTRRPAPDSAR